MSFSNPEGQTYRDVEYGRGGGQSLRLDAFVPSGNGPFPAAVIVHGGAWVAGDRRWNVEPLFEPLAEAGLAWFSISYTLATDVSQFGAAIHDVEEAVRYVAAHAANYRVDAGRLVLIGESAGGQLAAMAALGTFPLPVRAVVAFYAPSDLEQLAHSAARLHPSGQAFLGTRFANAVLARAKDLSPVRFVRAGMPPFLLIHGTADALIPFDQSETMCRAIRKAGGVCDLIAVRGGGHGLRWWESAGLTGYKRLLIGWLKTRV